MKDSQKQNLEIAYMYLQGLIHTADLNHAKAPEKIQRLIKLEAVKFTCMKFGVTRADLIGLDRLKFPANIGGHLKGHFRMKDLAEVTGNIVHE